MSLNLDKSTWKRVAFGDIIENITERVDDPSEANVDRYVGLEHLDSGVLTVQRWDKTDKVTAQKLRFKPGDVIFARRRAYQKKVALAEFEGICSAHALVLRARPDYVHPEFLPVFLGSDYFLDRAIAISVGSLSPTVNWRDLKVEEFDLPTLDDQKRLAALFWAVERCRLSLVKAEDRISSAATTRFDSLLADGQWEDTPVSDLVVSGPRNGKSAPANDEGRGVPTLSISAVRNGQIRGGKSIKHIDVPANDVANFVLQHDDFLVVRGNGNRQFAALGGLVRGGLPDGCIYPDLLIRLKFDRAKILPEFAAAQWNSRSAHRALLQKAKSTNGIWKINGKDVKSHRLVVPPLDDQLEILRGIESFRAASEAVSVELEHLATVRLAFGMSIFGGAL